MTPQKEETTVSTSSAPRRLVRYSAFCRSRVVAETVRALVLWHGVKSASFVQTSSEFVVYVPRRRRHRYSIDSSNPYVSVTYSPPSRDGDCAFPPLHQQHYREGAMNAQRTLVARVEVIPSEFGDITKQEHNDDDDNFVYIDPLLAIHLGCYNDAVEMALLKQHGISKKVILLRLQSISIPVTGRNGRPNAVTLHMVGHRRVPPVESRMHHAGRSLQSPLPPVGTLLQSSTLIRVTAPVRRDDLSSNPGILCPWDEYFYEVQISSAEGEEEEGQVDFLVTNTDTHFTVLRRDHRTMWPPLLPPLVTGVPSSPAEEAIPPHPNAPDLLRAFWTTIGQPQSCRPAQCIWHLLGTRYEHHAPHLVKYVAHQLGRTCLSVSGLAAAAFLYSSNENDDDPYTVTTGGWLDKLHGLQRVLQHAMAQAPSVLLLDRLDQEFTQSETRSVDESRLWNLIVETLSIPKDESPFMTSHTIARTPPVLVVLLTREALPVGPMRQNLWHPSIPLALPDAAYIDYLWQSHPEEGGSTITSSANNIASMPSDIPMETVQQLLQGRCAGEILDLRREWRRSLAKDDTTEKDDAVAALKTLCETRDDARRHVSGRIAPVHWSDVGGLEHVRREIMDAIELPLQYPVLFGSARRSGILLYGPPGTGKTLVAKAVATECGVPFVSVMGPELLGSYVGESEAQVRSTFSQARRLARQNQPPACILFFDELDSIAPRRGDHACSGGGAVMDRVVATLFAELDRGPDDDGAFVFCMGATNRPDMLDPALLRPGRFDRLVYLGVSSTDYANILVTHLRKLRLSDSPEAMAELLIPHLPSHLTGADLSTIATRALIRATERLCSEADLELDLLRQQNDQNGDGSEDVTLDDVLSSWDESRLEPVVTLDDLLDAARHVVPSVNAAELEGYEQIHRKYRQESTSTIRT